MIGIRHFAALLGFGFVAAWIGLGFGWAILCLIGAAIAYWGGAFAEGGLALADLHSRFGTPGRPLGSPPAATPPPRRRRVR